MRTKIGNTKETELTCPLLTAIVFVHKDNPPSPNHEAPTTLADEVHNIKLTGLRTMRQNEQRHEMNNWRAIGCAAAETDDGALHRRRSEEGTPLSTTLKAHVLNTHPTNAPHSFIHSFKYHRMNTTNSVDMTTLLKTKQALQSPPLVK